MTGFRRRRDQGGAAAVEFGLIMIPFFVLVFGLLEYGWYFYVAQNTSGAASTVARKMEVGDCWASGEAQAFAHSQSGQVTSVTNSLNATASPAAGTAFTVTVVADGKLLNFLPIPDGGTITRTVSAQVEDEEPTSC